MAETGRLRTLYFDIDGTLLTLYTPDAKPALAAGTFGRALRQAGFQKLVCISVFGRFLDGARL